MKEGGSTMAHARIYRPAKTAMQSGKAKTHAWRLDYETASPRAPDPLMGWASAADTLNEVNLSFATLEEAVSFATQNGLDYTVIEPREVRFRPKSYADNFRWHRPG
jgi:hypothetical protein